MFQFFLCFSCILEYLTLNLHQPRGLVKSEAKLIFFALPIALLKNIASITFYWSRNLKLTFPVNLPNATHIWGKIGAKVIGFSGRDTNTRKICEAVFSLFYNISQLNVAVLLFLGCSCKLL